MFHCFLISFYVWDILTTDNCVTMQLRRVKDMAFTVSYGSYINVRNEII